MNTPSLRVVTAVLKKDVQSFYPLLLLVAALQAIDVVVAKLDPWPTINVFLPMMLVLANSILVLSIVQNDPPASLIDDWLCRPLPRGALVLAKLSLFALALYLPRTLCTLTIDLLQDRTFAESALEALLFRNWIGAFDMLYLPIVLMAALCTATAVQGIGVMIGLFVLIFVIPTPFVSPPGPEDLAVGEALLGNGMQWIALFTAKLVFVVAAALCLWAAYRRRNLLAARSALAGGVMLGLLAIFTPMFLLPWQSTFALQATLSGDQHVTAPTAYSLSKIPACFPAARVGDLVSQGGNINQVAQRFGVELWSERQLTAAGNDAVMFVTQVRAHGLPNDWRLQVAYAQAKIHDSESPPLLTLRPARYTARSINGLAGETIAHGWLVPEAGLRKITAAVKPKVDIDYSVAVLAPASAKLLADGKRHYLSGIGYCGATLKALDNKIEVDCFSAGHQPAMISAELNDIPASRVDSAPIDFSPSWLQALSGQRVKLEIQSPNLVESKVVTVHAYYAQTFTTLRVPSEGLLGDNLSACPLPSPEAVTALPVSSWNDRSPHQNKSIAIESGVQLEVLDWGGDGTPVLLIPGLGATAHSFDELAPLLAKRYRVLGITRRGIGASSRPDHGYSQARLTQDIVQVLDAFDIKKAIFVGHSIAGDELSTLGVRHSERVAGLIYLDAAYDRGAKTSKRYRELSAALPDQPEALPEELQSYEALRAYFDRVGAAPLPEGELIATWNVGNRYLVGRITADPRMLQAIAANITSPDYAHIHVPALAIYATSSGTDSLMKPWYDPNDAALRANLLELQALQDARRRRDIEKFRNGIVGSRVIEIPGAAHWIILSNRDDVLHAIADFISTLPAATSNGIAE